MTPKEFKTLEEFVEWIDINYFSYDKFEKDTLLKKLLEIYMEKEQANKCQYCGSENGNHKLSCPVIKVTMLL